MQFILYIDIPDARALLLRDAERKIAVYAQQRNTVHGVGLRFGICIKSVRFGQRAERIKLKFSRRRIVRTDCSKTVFEHYYAEHVFSVYRVIMRVNQLESFYAVFGNLHILFNNGGCGAHFRRNFQSKYRRNAKVARYAISLTGNGGVCRNGNAVTVERVSHAVVFKRNAFITVVNAFRSKAIESTAVAQITRSADKLELTESADVQSFLHCVIVVCENILNKVVRKPRARSKLVNLFAILVLADLDVFAAERRLKLQAVFVNAEKLIGNRQRERKLRIFAVDKTEPVHKVQILRVKPDYGARRISHFVRNGKQYFNRLAFRVRRYVRQQE